ncbi:IMP 5'-nucleotidase [Dispira simplex]|nr:IMP 5'-nucleotidase [Dispira simplex]
MTSVYRINYHLRAHKRDPLIEFIKGMLLTPFVLHATPSTTMVDQVPTSDPSLLDNSSGSTSHVVPYMTDTCTSLVETQAIETPGSDPCTASHDALPFVLRRNSDAIRANELRYAEIMGDVEGLIAEHITMQEKGLEKYSRLRRLVPTIGTFFTPLPLRDAFLYSNAKYAIASRKYIPPSFNEIRRILNTAQVWASAPHLKFITFDGDMTLYPDGQTFEEHSHLVGLIIQLLQADLTVAIVTAAGYTMETARYEARISGLLKGFATAELSPEQLARFYVMGGECNYLFQCGADYGLHYIPENQYASSHQVWSDHDLQNFLDVAELNLWQCVKDMKLNAKVLRKPKAVGLVPFSPLNREQLDECALSTQQCLLQYNRVSTPDQGRIPFCAFNGGSDVWVDIGNKLIGVQLLQKHLHFSPKETVHVGDQFLSTGNDIATRTACCTCWIINPEETQGILEELLQRLT